MEDQEPRAIRIQDPASAGWHADKRVPLAIIGAIFLQTFGLGWYVSGQSARLDNVEKSGIRNEATINQMQSERQNQHDRVVVLEGDQKHTIELLQRIEAKVDKIIK